MSSEVKGTVGSWELVWKSVPRGASGMAHVEVRRRGASGAGKLVEVRWRRDADGLWLELPDGVRGYDFEGESGDDGRVVYRLTRRGLSGGDESREGLSFARAGEEQAAAGAAGARKGTRVRAQMPGKILRILAQAGAQVEKGQPILVMEAMKMENEIRAPQSGTLGTFKVTEGQAVETGADLVELKG